MPQQAPVSASDLRHVCAELEQRLRAGDDCGAELVFAAHPDLADDGDTALEVIYTEFVAREELGQRPSAEDFCRRFPRWLAGLRQVFEIHGAVGAEAVRSRPTLTQGPRTAAGNDGGRRVGDYELLGEIGRGGMGVVYRARQCGLNRLGGAQNDPDRRRRRAARSARFRAEAEAAARLQHPNIVQIHEVGEHEGRPFLVLEYVAGGTLDDRRTDTPWPAAMAAGLITTLARAIHHAHQQGVVHRDLKPANILLSGGRDQEPGATPPPTDCPLPPDSWVPKITDFGLARRLPAGDTAELARTAPTQSGAIVGTPAYMAPEQAGGGTDAGPAVDVYALGVILYELLTGCLPFRGVDALATLEQVRTHEPPAPSRLAVVPRDLETICLKCLHKEPARRYRSAAELADDLGRFLAGEPVRARPTPAWERAWKWAHRRPAVAALLAALTIVTLGGLASSTWLWRQTAAALRVARARQAESDAALASRLVALAQRDWLANDLEAARRRLDECPPILRGPDWADLDRLCRACRLVLVGSGRPITALAWSPDGHSLIGNGSPKEAIVWDPDTGAERCRLTSPRTSFATLAFDADGGLLAFNRRLPRLPRPVSLEVTRWDLTTQTSVRTFTAGPSAERLALSADGRRLALAGSGAVTVVELAGGTTAASLPVRGNLGVTRLALSSDGARLAWAWDYQTVRVNDTASGAQLARILSRSELLAFSPDGGRLAVMTYDSDLLTTAITLWDVQSARALGTLRGHASMIDCLAFSRDGQRLVTGSADRTVIVWDLDACEPLVTLRGHTGRVFAVDFHPDGTQLASGGHDGTVRIWDLRPFAPRPAPAGP